MASDTSHPSNSRKIEDNIIDTIVHLRGRKARPDFDRICRLMYRRHQVSTDDTQQVLDRMVSDNQLIRVEFKGSSSYRVFRRGMVVAPRPAAPTDPTADETAPKRTKKRDFNSASETRRLLEAVHSVNSPESPGKRSSSALRSTRADQKKVPEQVGAHLVDIERYLARNKASGPNNKKLDDRQRLLAALQSEIRAGTLQQLDNGSYVMCVKEEIEEHGEEEDVEEEDESEEDRSSNTPKTASPSPSSSKSTVSTKSVSPTLKAVLLVPQKRPVGRPIGSKKATVPFRLPPSVAVKRESESEEESNEGTDHSSSSPGTTPDPKRRKIAREELAESPVVPTRRNESVVVGMVALERRFRKNRVQPVVKSDVFRAPAPVPVRVSNRINKRKRFKKTHGPDFVENYDSSFEEPISKCDSCNLPETCNLLGDREDFLSCSECHVKVHPTCMSYSLDLALLCRRSPWQCFDCRPCCVCQEADEQETMLFCDWCDKGYHMACHNPEVMDKPSARWRCRHCRAETDRRDRDCGAICSNVPAESEPEEEEEGEEEEEVEQEEEEEEEEEEEQEQEQERDDDSDSSDSAPPVLTRQTPLSPTPVVADDEVKTDEEAKAGNADGESSKCTVDGETGLPTPCDSPVPEVQQNKRPFLMYFGQPNKFDENKENMLASCDVPDATDWSVDEVEKYIDSIGFTDQAKSFVEQEIDGKSLLLMKRSDVLTGLALKLGPALKIYKYVRRLQVKHAEDCRS